MPAIIIELNKYLYKGYNIRYFQLYSNGRGYRVLFILYKIQNNIRRKAVDNLIKRIIYRYKHGIIIYRLDYENYNKLLF